MPSGPKFSLKSKFSAITKYFVSMSASFNAQLGFLRVILPDIFHSLLHEVRPLKKLSFKLKLKQENRDIDIDSSPIRVVILLSNRYIACVPRVCRVWCAVVWYFVSMNASFNAKLGYLRILLPEIHFIPYYTKKIP